MLNKIDLLSGSAAGTPRGSLPWLGSRSRRDRAKGVEGLLEVLEAALPHPPVEVELLVPYGREDVTAMLYREAEVLSTTHGEAGASVHARVGLRELAAVREFVRAERQTG